MGNAFFFGKNGCEPPNRVAFSFLLLHFFPVTVGCARVADVVPSEPIGIAIEQRRAAAFACAGDGRLRRSVNLQHIVSINGNARHIVGRRAHGDIFYTLMLVLRRAHPEAVVFTDKHHRQVPHGGEIERFVEDTLVRRAIAEERDGDLLRATEFGGEPGTGGERNTRADNAVGTQNPCRFISDVHGAALAFAVACRASEQLRHHPVALATLRDEMSVAAVCAGNVIGIFEVRANADGCGFFTDIEVQEAGKLPALIQRPGGFFKLTDFYHLTIHPKHPVFARF